MLVQRFEPQGRRFTNFHIIILLCLYYYIIMFTINYVFNVWDICSDVHIKNLKFMRHKRAELHKLHFVDVQPKFKQRKKRKKEKKRRKKKKRDTFPKQFGHHSHLKIKRSTCLLQLYLKLSVR